MQLLPEKALYLIQHKILLLADLHFGKVNHFRKAGIAVPAKANKKNAETLIDLIQRTKPERIIFLGDLFHSHYNEDWEVIGQIRKHFAHLSFELVIGNHDIMSEQQYKRHSLQLHQKELKAGNFLLTHEVVDELHDGLYNLSGHMHPGVRLRGMAKQSMMLPCFYFGKSHGILPAFGSFTGLAKITPKRNEKVFVIAEGKIVEV